MSRKLTAALAVSAAALAVPATAPADVLVNDTFENLGNFTIDVNPDGDAQQNVNFGTINGVGNPGSGGFVRNAQEGASSAAEQLGFLTRTVDAAGFENLTVSLDAAARDGSTWEGPEFISIEVDTGSGFQTIVQDFGLPGAEVAGTGDGTFVELAGALPASAADGSFDLRLGFNVGFYNATSAVREIYFYDNLVVEGSPIPEPAAALSLAGLCSLGLRRRSR